MLRAARLPIVVLIFSALVVATAAPPCSAQVKKEDVERAIRDGVSFLKREQRGDGSWPDFDPQAHSGMTSLVTLALLTAGETRDEPHVAKALAYLQELSANDLGRTYTVALQTMVYAAADPARFKVAITNNVAWLEKAQIKPGDPTLWPGSWSYTAGKDRAGDNSNSQYALLGLHAASEVGVPVNPRVWVLARSYWESGQKRRSGGWTYHPADQGGPSGSMTCAGISSLVITGLKRYQGQERLIGDAIQDCGKGGFDLSIQNGVDWLAANFAVGQNMGKHGQQWKYYYLYGLERAGRLTGQRYFGNKDWYRLGAEHLVREQQALGSWSGNVAPENEPTLATSFAILFLAKGRTPVVVNKLRHGPEGDWDNDVDDVRNLVGVVSRDWKHQLTWQVVDPDTSEVADLLQAPILFFNGHRAPEFSSESKKKLREFVEQGGFIFAEACCSDPAFDQGFRVLMKQLFPEPDYNLKPLPDEHPIWRARHVMKFDDHPLFGIEHGCRTVVVYSPSDLSCYWNQMESQPDNPAVLKAQKVGQNVIDYATGRELPADKLTVRELHDFKAEATAKRGALHIAKLRHAGDWNVAPLAIPNLTTMLRDKLGLDVVINHREIFPKDPNLYHYPLIYIHGRANLSFFPDELKALRRHLEPGGGTLFADAACGSAAFNVGFRKFVAELLPNVKLEPIPADDEIYTKKGGGFELSNVQYSKAAGGGQGRPQLEGVKLNGHWAVIYSKYNVGCALERQQGLDCKGYTHESAMRIAANIVIYSTLP